MGLRQLAYPINKKFSGIYYCMEFSAENGVSIPKMELALRRDERIMRFLTVRLDKYGVKYNQDKRDGKIGVAKKIEKKSQAKSGRDNRNSKSAKAKAAPAPAPKPAPAPAPAKSEEE